LIKAANLIAAPYNWVLTNHDSLGLLTIILRVGAEIKNEEKYSLSVSKIVFNILPVFKIPTKSA